MSENTIFRKAAMDRLSTPEQLDHLMQVTTPKGWYALYTLCGLLGVALVWSVFGSLPTTISGPALIMPPNGVEDIYAPDTGVVKQLLVKEDDLVKAGDVVAILEQKSAAERGVRSKAELQQKIAASKEKIGSLEKQVASRQSALAQGLIAPMDLENAKQSLLAARSELASYQNQLDLGGMALKDSSEVKAENDGRIVEILSSPGTRIAGGDSIMTYVSDTAELQAIGFIPSVGNQAKRGMSAEVSPRTIKKEEYGFMVGEVTYVSDFPARTHMMYELTKNRILMQELVANGAPYILRMVLFKDPEAASGFKWSSGHGPKEHIKPGMMCDVRVVVKRQRPISMVIPALKKFFGY